MQSLISPSVTGFFSPPRARKGSKRAVLSVEGDRLRPLQTVGRVHRLPCHKLLTLSLDREDGRTCALRSSPFVRKSTFRFRPPRVSVDLRPSSSHCSGSMLLFTPQKHHRRRITLLNSRLERLTMHAYDMLSDTSIKGKGVSPYR